VIIFGRRDGQLHPTDRFRILVALVPSLGGAFLAWVPVGLDLAGLPPFAVWRVSSLMLVVAVVADEVHGSIRLYRLSPEARTILSSSLTGLLRALRLFAFVAGVLNATGILFDPQPGAYFFAVLCPLLMGAIVFVRIVFVRPAV
jgi:hypothetical protein